jgi:FAD:protein FMN transferase
MLAIRTLSQQPVIFRRDARLMGSRFEISVVGNDPNWADERIDDAIAEINRIEKLLSTFSDDTPINEINRNAGIRPVKTPAEIFNLVDRCLQISELTHGAFDVTYCTDKNGAAASQQNVPGAGDIRFNYQNVALDAKEQTVFLKEEGMRIGFGANIKGYAADRAKYLLQMRGVSSGVINTSGDLLAWGSTPAARPWTIATADPAQRSQRFANVEISNMAIATSVNTGNQTAAIDKKYATAVNPEKGFLVSGIKSVSVISVSAELADSMATPVMAIGLNAGLYLVNQLNQMACIIIDDHDRIYTSKDVSIVD